MKLATIIAVLAIAQTCAAQKKKAELLYNYPPGIVEEKKAEFIQFCEKGKTLYGIHCSGCHSRTVDGKEIVPDFTPMQLDAYDMRLGFTKHQSTLTERNIPEEELELVIFFLSHKKSNKELEEMNAKKKKKS